MKRYIRLLTILFTATLLLTGCAVQTVDEMYYPPKRSDEYRDLQSVIETAMVGLTYSAPLSGENRQIVQVADLDGDGVQEYILFAKADAEKPLRILIFAAVEDGYRLVETIACNGSAFDQVEYIELDRRVGAEIVVGRQVSNQVLRTVSAYALTPSGAQQILSANYTKFLTVDLIEDGIGELFVLRPGDAASENGIAEIYSVIDGAVERSNEVSISRPADQLKRVITGKLHGGQSAVYVASAVGDTAIITDVYAVNNGRLKNVTLTNESGTSVQTMRNYYVYADDIDSDGVVELPALIPMKSAENAQLADKHDLIRWYAMTANGGELDKMYTYHNFVGGWYIELQDTIAHRITVSNLGYRYEFYLWDERLENIEKLMTVYVLTGQNRENDALEGDRFILSRSESVIYAATLESGANDAGITNENLIASFRMIQQDWKTGET